MSTGAVDITASKQPWSPAATRQLEGGHRDLILSWRWAMKQSLHVWMGRGWRTLKLSGSLFEDCKCDMWLPIVSRLCRVDNYIVSMWRLNHICRGPGTNYKRWVPCRSWVSRGRGDTIAVFIVIVDVEKLVVSCWLRMLGIVFWAAACLRTIARTCGTLFSQQCRVQGLVLLELQTQISYFLLISKHFN